MNELICEHGKDWARCSRCIGKNYCGCCGEATTGDWCRDEKAILEYAIRNRKKHARYGGLTPSQIRAKMDSSRR